MATWRRPNTTKALEVLVYVTTEVHDLYHALKVIYFAEKQHLQDYGRLIYGDSYVAMKLGPVPSLAYDIIKGARGDGQSPVECDASGALSVDGYNVTPRREPNLDLLSQSDMECLGAAIQRYGSMPFNELVEESHNDKAFQSADEMDVISLTAIAESLPNADELLEHLCNG